MIVIPTVSSIQTTCISSIFETQRTACNIMRSSVAWIFQDLGVELHTSHPDGGNLELETFIFTKACLEDLLGLLQSRCPQLQEIIIWPMNEGLSPGHLLRTFGNCCESQKSVTLYRDVADCLVHDRVFAYLAGRAGRAGRAGVLVNKPSASFSTVKGTRNRRNSHVWRPQYSKLPPANYMVTSLSVF